LSEGDGIWQHIAKKKAMCGTTSATLAPHQTGDLIFFFNLKKILVVFAV